MLWRTQASRRTSAERARRQREMKRNKPIAAKPSPGSFLALIKKREWRGAQVVGIETRTIYVRQAVRTEVYWVVEHPSGARCLLLIPGAEA